MSIEPERSDPEMHSAFPLFLKAERDPWEDLTEVRWGTENFVEDAGFELGRRGDGQEQTPSRRRKNMNQGSVAGMKR